MEGFKYTGLILLILPLLALAAISKKDDCAQKGRSFRKISSTVFTCTPGNDYHQCYPGYAIPEYMPNIVSEDPCVCVRTNQSSLICPSEDFYVKSSQSKQQTYKNKDARQASGGYFISDKGCPAPYLKYPNTFRNKNADAVAFLIPINGNDRRRDGSEQCKLGCYNLDTCLAVMYGPHGSNRPECLGFMKRGEKSTMRMDADYDYWAKTENCQASTDARQHNSPAKDKEEYACTKPVKMHSGSVLPGAQQMGGHEMKGDVSEASCYYACMMHTNCQGADYNCYLKRCFLHVHHTGSRYRTVTCDSHKGAKAINHFKKNMQCRAVGGQTRGDMQALLAKLTGLPPHVSSQQSPGVPTQQRFFSG